MKSSKTGIKKPTSKTTTRIVVQPEVKEVPPPESLADWVEDTHLINLLKEISWSYDNIFSPGDEDNILNSVITTDRIAYGIANNGRTASTASELGDGMWVALNQSITGKPGTTLENFFEDIYRKLACCTNQSEIVVPILKQTSDGKVEKIYKRLTFDIKGEGKCMINGRNWYDDNQTLDGYNPRCEEFMTRLIAFLDKYDPNNEMLNTFGGCMANVNLPKSDSIDAANDPALLSIINSNRSCFMSTCNASAAYKRQQDRKSCQTTICTAKINFNDIDAGNAVNLLGNTITQKCGTNSELSKSLEASKEGTTSSTQTSTGTTSTTQPTTGTTTSSTQPTIGTTTSSSQPTTETTTQFDKTSTGVSLPSSTVETEDKLSDNNIQDIQQPSLFSRFFMWLASLFSPTTVQTESFDNIDIKNMDKRIKLIII